jgi:hypothetical protein
MSDPVWKRTGMEMTQASMAIALRPMAEEAAISVGVIV